MPHVPQKRKREPRTSVACNECRKRKAKCDGKHPCTQCSNLRVSCVFSPSASQSSRHGSRNPSDMRLHTAVTSDSQQASSKHQLLPHTGGDVGVERRYTHLRSDVATLPSTSSDSAQHFDRRYTSVAHAVANDLEPPPLNAASAHVIDRSPVDATRGHSDSPGNDADMTESVGEFNTQTCGTEFYGAAGILPFLNRLRQRAQFFTRMGMPRSPKGDTRVEQHENQNQEGAGESQASPIKDLSIVNYLYNAEYQTREPRLYQSNESTAMRRGPMLQRNQTQLVTSHTHTARDFNDHPSTNEPKKDGRYHATLGNRQNQTSNTDGEAHQRRRLVTVERAFLITYFRNLHLIHPIIDKESFMAFCDVYLDEKESGRSIGDRNVEHRQARFVPVYYAVLALGAIVASKDSTECIDPSGTIFAESFMHNGNDLSKSLCNVALAWANVFFEKSKALLGDVFQVSSLESTQALFLLSVFCQNALQPHSCYMYSGVAARTALAIGMSNELSSASEDRVAVASRTWWCIYAHEVEMCCSSGRDTLLREPSYYRTPMPISVQPKDQGNSTFISTMVELANILRCASEELYHSSPNASVYEKASIARQLGESLEKWKTKMPSPFSLNKTSVTESESLSKQKIVMRLGYQNAQILIYRPFLEVKDLTNSMNHEIGLCLRAARDTVRLLHDTYINRPYFRTWWYNTTYALNACMIILYVMFLGIHEASHDELIADIERGFEVFHAMENVTVTARCALLVQEVFEVAKETIVKRKSIRDGVHEMERNRFPYAANAPNGSWETNAIPGTGNVASIGNTGFNHEELYANLFDPNIMQSMEHAPSNDTGNTETPNINQPRNGSDAWDDWQFDQKEWGGVFGSSFQVNM